MHQEYITLQVFKFSFSEKLHRLFQTEAGSDKAVPSNAATANILACINIQDEISSCDAGFLHKFTEYDELHTHCYAE